MSAGASPMRPLGCGALHVIWEDLGEIRTLAVNPKVKGHGVGHALVARLLTEARTIELERVFVLTFETTFFSRHGFVEIDGTRHETKAMLVAIGNGPAYGGGMKVTPDASFDDGLLDVLILHEIGMVEFLRVFPKVFTGTHVSHPAVEIIRGRSVRLEAEGIVSYADGERFAPLPLHCEVVPGAATVLA